MNYKQSIIKCLKDIKGSGRFMSNGSEPFFFPGLEVDGVEELSYPIQEAQIKALTAVAGKAPFGKGGDTILDHNVRNGWAKQADRNEMESAIRHADVDLITETIKKGSPHILRITKT